MTINQEQSTVKLTIGELEIPGSITLKNVNVESSGVTAITDTVMALQSSIEKTIVESSWFGKIFAAIADNINKIFEMLLRCWELSLKREEEKMKKEKKEKEKEEKKRATKK